MPFGRSAAPPRRALCPEREVPNESPIAGLRAHAWAQRGAAVIVFARRVAWGNGFLGFVVVACLPVPHVEQDCGNRADQGDEGGEEFEEQQARALVPL